MRILVLLGALSVAVLSTPAFSAPLPKEAADALATDISVARITHRNNPEKVREACRAAEQKAAQYDCDPFYDAFIAGCFGTVEAQLKNKQAACNHYARVIEWYQAVHNNHPEYSNVKDNMELVQQERKKLGC